MIKIMIPELKNQNYFYYHYLIQTHLKTTITIYTQVLKGNNTNIYQRKIIN